MSVCNGGWRSSTSGGRRWRLGCLCPEAVQDLALVENILQDNGTCRAALPPPQPCSGEAGMLPAPPHPQEGGPEMDAGFQVQHPAQGDAHGWGSLLCRTGRPQPAPVLPVLRAWEEALTQGGDTQSHRWPVPEAKALAGCCHASLSPGHPAAWRGLDLVYPSLPLTCKSKTFGEKSPKQQLFEMAVMAQGWVSGCHGKALVARMVSGAGFGFFGSGGHRNMRLSVPGALGKPHETN